MGVALVLALFGWPGAQAQSTESATEGEAPKSLFERMLDEMPSGEVIEGIEKCQCERLSLIFTGAPESEVPKCAERAWESELARHAAQAAEFERRLEALMVQRLADVLARQTIDLSPLGTVKAQSVQNEYDLTGVSANIEFRLEDDLGLFYVNLWVPQSLYFGEFEAMDASALPEVPMTAEEERDEDRDAVWGCMLGEAETLLTGLGHTVSSSGDFHLVDSNLQRQVLSGVFLRTEAIRPEVIEGLQAIVRRYAEANYLIALSFSIDDKQYSPEDASIVIRPDRVVSDFNLREAREALGLDLSWVARQNP